MNAVKKKGKRKWLKILLAVFAILVLGLCITGWSYYKKVFHPNINITKNETYLYIPTGSDFDAVMQILQNKGWLINTASFEWVAELKNYPSQVKPGKYKIKKGMSNNDLVNLLRSGRQEPVKVTFNNIRKPEELAGRVASYIEADSISIIDLYRSSEAREEYGFAGDKFFTMFIPNTYEFYWNTSAEDFFERMAKEYKDFWNEERKEKAKRTGLSQSEITILASIVEKESLRRDEQPSIAGVYINRIRTGMLLQADPTVVFAIGDFTIKRVLKKQLEFDSPYNTYIHKGLPPGPICLPQSSTIDAVLNYKDHKYLYFCAKEDFSGYHNFAKNLEQHNLNARKYQAALNKLNIKK
ncbi:MAG: endolytic transglycosylase MltG [Bacteroidetes bacterium HGW-Bacteroidetes-21]|jgi:UPF0755 protein|nr:MAG: endolytic transglycosylase MltG [Bacteroidetes bacterium HGW-Bacteroidetes-21]